MTSPSGPRVLAFSPEQTCRLTSLSLRQLRYWDGTGFFSPHYADDDRRRPFSRVYSFRDVVGLRAIAALRQRHLIPLQELRSVGRWLADRYDSPWSELTFYVAGRRIFFDDPKTGARTLTRSPDQTAFPFQMERVAFEAEREIERLSERAPEDIGRVVRNRFLVHNAPVLAGTRIPTSAIWNLHQDGYDTARIIREYPRLTASDVRAAIGFEEDRRRERAG